MIAVKDLIEILSDLNPEAEVRIAYQPDYPLWGVAYGVAEGDANGGALMDGLSLTCETCGEEGFHLAECPRQDTPVEQHHEGGTAQYVYITVSDSDNGYARGNLWEAGRVFA